MHVIVGLSGGPDSTCLFHALASLRGALGFEISAVHVNHGLRPGDAERDALFAEELCRAQGAPFFGFERDVGALALALGVGAEEAGRDARYGAFFETASRVAAEKGCGASRVRIAVAHNRNDQAETVLMRIMRGTGPDGLAAMPYSRKSSGGFRVIRPLLDVPRTLIEEYCAAEGLSPARDLSNGEPIYLRNRIRLSLLPALESGYNENIVEALVRLASSAAGDREYFGMLTDKLLEEGRDAEDGSFSMPLAVFSEAHPALRRRLTVKCFERAGLLQDIGTVHLLAADALIESGRTGKLVEFPNGYRLSLRYGRLFFFRDDGKRAVSDVSAPPERTLKLGGFEENKALSVDIYSYIIKFSLSAVSRDNASASLPGRASPGIFEFDFDLLSAQHGEISIRRRRAGDFIRPAGMDGVKLIQDLFVDAKLPREKRDTTPLVALGNEILCVLADGRPGRRTGNYAVTPAAERILRLTVSSAAP
jgi:tRNA(Ile)-lysidine synthase